MGQTLTHGVYLPDEGERNCYAGLASNWQLLDGAVGTVAEHSTQIAGKAPLVHTHTKSDITDFPVYGTTAGTICEGNDSRLSDARTPVAHTHTKSNVTDLLNSNFIPSANNSYDLGSSSYQWNNLYAKNYYYNGVAWGLDKANVWSAIQTISYAGSNITIALKQQETDITARPTRNNWCYFNFYDKNSVALGGFNYSKRTNGNSRVYLNLRTKNTNNDIVEKNVFFETNQEGTDWNLYPASNADINLGTSTNKWKSLNGINPGALSLPNSPGGSGTVNVNYYDLSGNITVRDGSAANGFTASCDGWISIETFATWLQISNDTLIIATTAGIGVDGFAQAFLPVRKGNYIRVVVNQTNTQFQSFKLLPCEGNV